MNLPGNMPTTHHCPVQWLPLSAGRSLVQCPTSHTSHLPQPSLLTSWRPCPSPCSPPRPLVTPWIVTYPSTIAFPKLCSNVTDSHPVVLSPSPLPPPLFAPSSPPSPPPSSFTPSLLFCLPPHSLYVVNFLISGNLGFPSDSLSNQLNA